MNFKFRLMFELNLLVISTKSDNILLILDDSNILKTHSIFIESIKERGHVITSKLKGDSSLDLIKYGERLYDHLILFAPSAAGLFY